MHPFDQAVNLTDNGDGSFSGVAPKQYWNVVGPYGGITAAILLRGPMLRAEAIGEPLVLTVNFTAPVREGPFQLRLRLTRGGRTTQHWSVDMVQQSDDQAELIVGHATVVMGVRRALWSDRSARQPQAKPGHEARRRDGRNGLPWFDRYDLRFFSNPMKSDNPHGDTLSWVRDEPPRSLDYPALAALCDTFFPAMFALRQTYVPIATVSMNCYFHCSGDELTAHGSNYMLGRGCSNVYHHGFCDAHGELWAGQQLIATTQQVMWYRE